MFSLALNFGTIGTFAYLRYQDRATRLAHERRPPLPMRELWGVLKLDESQRQAARGLFLKHRAEVKEMRRELLNKRQGLFELLKTEDPAMDAIQTRIAEISALQANLEKELVRHLLDFRRQLKPEQRAALLDLVRSRMEQHSDDSCGPRGGRRSPGHGMGPPGADPGPGMGMGRGPRGPKYPD